MKRLFDIAASAGLLVLFSPVMLIVALLVRWRLGRPVIFRQLRPGLHGTPFEMIKFRTMREAFDDDGNPLPPKERMTSFGRRLRSTSLDELPELWNVLKGDMSIVGPRPLLMRYMPYYSDRELKRHDVRPGLTGLAQTNGRNSLTWDQKLAWDVEYVERQSFLLDMKIILSTVLHVVLRSGTVDAPPQGSLDEYRASRSD